MASGVAPRDRVGIWAPNRFEWVVAQYATARVGAILVNVNPAYRATELRHALARSGVRLLLLARAFRASDYVATLAEVRADCPALREAVVLEDGWDALLDRARHASGDALAAREAALQFDDPINIQYTSGTTGFPKGATLTHHNILNNGFFVGEGLGLTERDRVCIPVPFYHCFGRAPRTARAWWSRARRSTRCSRSRRRRPSGAPRSTASRRCSSPSWRTSGSPSSTCRRCAPGSWPAPPARWRS
jgi:fatty-acyl-CoA synthase